MPKASPAPDFLSAFDDLPFGTHIGTSGGRSYVFTKSSFSNGNSLKLVADERGGNDYISLNLYRLPSGKALLKPCEMPETKVIEFVLDLSLYEPVTNKNIKGTD
ncbi:hypothetical protein [Cochlodiniinecator piscidefendens]|uniref:hypothetical protein n=1 Tax=Cochlodiniinecator piscidefendens TaxID=2715756 RepID=UPI00140C20FC|nr:hypothetical protein [Cochlodiniinecator piscidefendens]